MAKRAARGGRGGGPNKTQAVKDYMTANPDAKPKDISAALKEQGIDVTPSYASNIKSTSGKKGGGRKKTRGKPGPKPRSAGSNGRAFDVTAIRSAAEFIKAAGGIKNARTALDAAEEIASALS